MAVNPKEECRERANVHDAESICLPGLKWQCRILVEPDIGIGVCPSDWA